MQSSLRALLLDFDGVLADSEPLHMKKFQEVLKEEGMTLTEETYYEKYLGYDDRNCFEKIYQDQGKTLTPEKKASLIQKKHDRMVEALRSQSLLLPGAKEFIEKVSSQYYLAIVSGALRSEIEMILETAGLKKKFHVMVAAEDVSQGKPRPDGFILAIRLLNRDYVPPSEILLAEECLVIEDSPWGLEAAKLAGVKSLALLTSYPRERLALANLIAPDLRHLKWDQIEGLFPIS